MTALRRQIIHSRHTVFHSFWNIPYKQLLIKRHQEHVAASRYTREQAIEMAKPYHLEKEVTDAFDTYGQSPDDALQDWDLYPYNSEK